MNQGTISIVLAAALAGAGLCLPAGTPRELVIGIGLFALCGGLASWLAAKLLFDRIPGLKGSGVLPACLPGLRSRLGRLASEHLFSQEQLERALAEESRSISWTSYLKRPAQGGGVAAFVAEEWDRVASPGALEPIVDAQLEKLMDSSIGGLLMMVGTDNVKPTVTQFLGSFAATVKSQVLAAAARLEAPAAPLEIDAGKLATDLRQAADRLLERRLAELTPEAVERALGGDLRRHLGWLVVWGAALGGAIGLAAALLRTQLAL